MISHNNQYNFNGIVLARLLHGRSRLADSGAEVLNMQTSFVVGCHVVESMKIYEVFL